MSVRALHAMIINCLILSAIFANGSNAQEAVSVREALIQMQVDNASLIKLLRYIEQKTSYEFTYRTEDLDKKVRISGDFSNARVSDVLMEVSKRTNLKFRQINNNIHVSKKSKYDEPQLKVELLRADVDVSGKITDESGVGLPGASVIIKGTANGTTSDLDGNYKLNVPEGAVLTISYVGYITQEIALGNQTVIDIQMELDASQLEEVVVTAFGLKREKKALGYAAQELKGEEFTEAREANIVNSLAGKVAGVQVTNIPNGAGGSSRVVIRGNSSISGNDAPLYVVDGVPIDNQNTDRADYASGGVDYGDGISGINPDDVETLTVLKGPNAAALYGSRAANGVILITTKSGKSKKGLGITINSNVTVDKLATLPTFQNKFAMGYDPDLPFDGTSTIDGVDYGIIDGRFWASWGPALEGQVVADWTDPTKTMTMTPQPVDNIESFFNTGITATNTLALTGGNENANIRFSISDMKNKGLIPGSTFDRQTISLRGNAKITDKLSIDSKVNYIKHQGHNRPQGGASSSNMMGAIIQLARHIDLDDLKNYKDENGNPINYTTRIENPYWTINEVVNEDERERIIGFVTLKYDLNDWLSVQARSGTDFYTDQRFTRSAIGSRSASSGQVSNYTWQVEENNSDILLMGQKDLSSDFALSVTLGASHLSASREVTGSSGKGLRSAGLYHISNANEVTPRYEKVQREMSSLFGTGQIAYKNFLFLDVTGRNDWSSVLGMNNYSFFYPSVSTSFVFTDALEINSKILTFGKLRAGYAEVGNGSDPYLTSIGYVSSTETINGQGQVEIQNRIPNPNLKNELTKSVEFGANIRLFGNRAGIDLTYYKASAKNQILPVNISSATGYANMVINAGEITNEGFELLLDVTPIKMENSFKWDLAFNFAKNKSKVVSLANGVETHEMSRDRWGTIEARPGEDFGNIVGFYYKRNEKGEKLLDANGRYQRDGNNTKVLGNIQPDWIGGITNTISYKGIALSALIDIKMGGEILSGTKYIQAARGTGKFTTDGIYQNSDGLWVGVSDGVMENDYYIEDGNGDQVLHLAAGEKSDIELPRHFLTGQYTRQDIIEEFVLDASYISLRQVTLEYSLPKTLLSNSPFSSVKISAVGRNLYYIDQHMQGLGITPESAFNTASGSQGSESYTAPSTRSIGFNLKLTF
ncbi:SusC/RagA family TonB-linked outer membrane protein [Reichenbachiella sp. MALMAid0571]|uniref:SusC/RagA family TonB-linked outer membrane protein n=1 Tax=Reichenbachiella sp. MALMAid0571 TaxID=3143939 RepID=UPI0032E01C57